jgi:hypothetical protein
MLREAHGGKFFMKWRQWLLIGVLLCLLVVFWAVKQTTKLGPAEEFKGLLIWLALLVSVSLPLIGLGYLIRRLLHKPDSN